MLIFLLIFVFFIYINKKKGIQLNDVIANNQIIVENYNNSNSIGNDKS